MVFAEPGIAHEKIRENVLGGAGALPSGNVEIETKICVSVGFARRKYFSAIIDFDWREGFQALCLSLTPAR